MNCSKCDSTIEASWNFCSNCGLKFYPNIIHDLTQVNDKESFLQKYESAIQRENSIILLQARWSGDDERISDVSLNESNSSTGRTKTTTYYNSFEEFKPECILEYFPVSEMIYPQTFKLLLGRRKFKVDLLSFNRDQRLKAFFEKWDCQESKTVRDWYFLNNTDYKNEYNQVIKRFFIDTCEIILTNTSINQTKDIVLNHIQSWKGRVLEQLSPKIEPYTTITGRGYKEAHWIEDDFDIEYANYMESVENKKMYKDLKNNSERNKQSYDDAMNHRLPGHFGG
ncbi:hypothetical protein HQN89_35555 [Paenibacillus frigoriresistens]|uniref:hypothetical protein n=1 Tax=Paenibacillus alginolyticus TaxID=59839 RepID=UPI0015641A84|nr:hypothetical protein [Paenibacillus frigoriresistens]NRF96115.1 hypothetical protein [Paenibacillus frigoriresistens]